MQTISVTEIAFGLAVALCIGSYVGMLVHRLPGGDPAFWGRSHCRTCQRTLALRDLVPVLSWIASLGRCRYCHRPIGRIYPLIEIAAVGASLWSFWVMPGWLAWPTCGLGWTLLALAVLDSRHMTLPDVLTLPLIPAGLGVILIANQDQLWSHAAGAAAGFALVVAIAWLYRTLKGREGIGLGDAKLLAAAGAWTDLQGLPSVLLIAASSALTILLLQAWLGKRTLRSSAKLPFGPYLAAGFWLVWLYGPLISQ